MEQLEAIISGLLGATSSSRTTVRLDWPDWGARVDDVVAEAGLPGVASRVGQTSVRQRDAETIKWLEDERRILVQDDCATARPAPPQQLPEVYGVRAQMLASVVVGGSLTSAIEPPCEEARSRNRAEGSTTPPAARTRGGRPRAAGPPAQATYGRAGIPESR